MAFTIPPRPAAFTPQGVAPGCERIANLYARELLGRQVDILTVHTNWAGGEGDIESAQRWTLSAPGSNTYAHYHHDTDGRAAKMLDTNRRGIGTAGTSAYWSQFNMPNASWRSLTYETADRGTRTDPAPVGSYFTDKQMYALARDLAYECVVWKIPPILLPHPTKRGIVGHCKPFPYPAFTTANGKQCPGDRKYKQLVDVVIPWTAAIVSAWTSTPVPVPKPPAPTPDVPADQERSLQAHGWYRLRAGEWPYSVARRILNDGNRHPEITAINRPVDEWEPDSFVAIPDVPAVLVTVKAGEGLHAVIKRAIPNEDPRTREAQTWEWNGGPHTLKVSEVVSVPVFWGS